MGWFKVEPFIFQGAGEGSMSKVFRASILVTGGSHFALSVNMLCFPILFILVSARETFWRKTDHKKDDGRAGEERKKPTEINKNIAWCE